MLLVYLSFMEVIAATVYWHSSYRTTFLCTRNSKFSRCYILRNFLSLFLSFWKNERAYLVLFWEIKKKYHASLGSKQKLFTPVHLRTTSLLRTYLPTYYNLHLSSCEVILYCINKQCFNTFLYIYLFLPYLSRIFNAF